MKLRLKDLDLIVKNELLLPTVTEAFKAEVRRVFGPSILIEGRSINEVSRDVNDQVDVIVRQGREVPRFNQEILQSLVTHTHPEVRRTVAGLGQSGITQKLMYDRDPHVRRTIASRVNTNQLSEMVRKFPKDDELGVIYVERVLNEAAPKKKEREYADFSDEWYKAKAYNLIQDYGHNHVNSGWIAPAVRAFCHGESSFGMHIDPQKLFNAVVELVDDYSEQHKKITVPVNMKAKTVNFDAQDSYHVVNEGKATIIRENVIPQFRTQYSVVDDILDVSDLTSLSENILTTIKVPMVCCTRGNRPINEVDERNLDKFVSAYNTRFKIQDIPLKLEWTTSVDRDGVAGFLLRGKF